MKYFDIVRNWQIFKGRIDIGLYTENNEAICPIEIKLVNPQNARIEKDIKRIFGCLKSNNYFNLAKAGFFVFVKQPIKCFARVDISKHVEESKVWIINYINNNFKDELQDFDFHISTKSVWECMNFHTYEEMDGMDPMDLGDEIKENIHLVGTIVRITLKNSRSPILAP